MVTINISTSVAIWMRDIAVKIFQDAYGTNWTPANAENAVFPHGQGFINELELERAPILNWIGATMSLVRCLAAILDHQLTTEVQFGDPDIESISVAFGDDES